MASTPLPFAEFSVLRALLAESLIEIAEVFESLDANLIAHELRQKHKILLDDTFRILVFGEMSRGKSTLINAMLGEALLPARRSRCTAIPCNVKYDDRRRAVLIRRPPFPPELIDPLRSPKELDKAVTIELGNSSWEDSGDEDARRLHPYVEADIFAPIEICSDGVMIQDSPGLNEAPERTAETLQKLKDADAVVYVLSCLQPLTESEQKEMRAVCERRKTRDIFFVLNFVDDTWDDPEDKEETERDVEPRIRAIAGYDATILYTSAKYGLRARQEGDSQLLQKTGIPQLETAIQSYLMEYRLSSKLRGPLTAAEDFISEGLVDVLLRRERLYREPVEALHRQLQKIQPVLREAENRRHQILATFSDRSKLIESDINELAGKLQADLESGVLEQLQQLDLSMWDAVAKRGEAKKRLARSVEVWMLRESEDWHERVLSDLLDRHMRELRSEVSRYAVELQRNLTEIKETLAEPLVSTSLNHEEEVPVVSRVLGFGLGFLGGPGSMIEGASFGVGPAAKGLAANILAGVVMNAALGLSAPVVGAALIGIGLIRIAMGADSFAQKLRAKLAEEIRASIRKSMPEIQRGLIDAVQSELTQERDRVDSRISAHISELTEQINSVLDERSKGELHLETAMRAIEEKRAQLRRQRSILAEIRVKIDLPSTAGEISSRAGSDLADLIAARVAEREQVIESKEADLGGRSLRSYLDVLENGASEQLDAVVNKLTEMNKGRGDLHVQIAKLWSFFPDDTDTKNPARLQREAYRAVTAIAVGNGMLDVPGYTVVSNWLDDPWFRKDLEMVGDIVSKEPLRFQEDVLPGAEESKIPVLVTAFLKRYRDALKRALPRAKQYLRAGTIPKAEDAPLPESRDG